jgi:hypothetical protein
MNPPDTSISSLFWMVYISSFGSKKTGLKWISWKAIFIVKRFKPKGKSDEVTIAFMITALCETLRRICESLFFKTGMALISSFTAPVFQLMSRDCAYAISRGIRLPVVKAPFIVSNAQHGFPVWCPSLYR